jgi:hypothetical protein
MYTKLTLIAKFDNPRTVALNDSITNSWILQDIRYNPKFCKFINLTYTLDFSKSSLNDFIQVIKDYEIHLKIIN